MTSHAEFAAGDAGKNFRNRSHDAEYKALYDGASLTRTQGGPVINIRYEDLAFASVGESRAESAAR
jgi:hypothetical protein